MSHPPGGANPRPSYQLFQDPAEKARLEARNFLLQYDEVVRLVQRANGNLSITPALIRNLHRLAIQDIYACAGNFRVNGVIIASSLHTPPPSAEVPALVDGMCAYANTSITRSPIHTAAFLLWRMNWIHPFMGGNGRTARALAYFALCVRLNCVLPGSNTILAQLVADRSLYVCACNWADALCSVGQINVAGMENILTRMLHNQLGGLFGAAIATPPPPVAAPGAPPAPPPPPPPAP